MLRRYDMSWSAMASRILARYIMDVGRSDLRLAATSNVHPTMHLTIFIRVMPSASSHLALGYEVPFDVAHGAIHVLLLLSHGGDVADGGLR